VSPCTSPESNPEASQWKRHLIVHQQCFLRSDPPSAESLPYGDPGTVHECPGFQQVNRGTVLLPSQRPCLQAESATKACAVPRGKAVQGIESDVVGGSGVLFTRVAKTHNQSDSRHDPSGKDYASASSEAASSPSVAPPSEVPASAFTRGASMLARLTVSAVSRV